jgi:RimJ/RimL family protein N-acetyltransferase
MFVTDESPKTKEDVVEYLKNYLPRVLSFGVIDRDNWLKMKHPAPIVGIIIFEPNSPHNGYLHIACTRRARGTRVIDQAVQGVINHLFETLPLLRISAFIPSTNYLAQSLAKRVGFVKEAIMSDMIVKDNLPAAMSHFGLLKRNHTCHFSPLLPPHSSPEVLAQSPVPLADEGTKADKQ